MLEGGFVFVRLLPVLVPSVPSSHRTVLLAVLDGVLALDVVDALVLVFHVFQVFTFSRR